MQVSGVLGMKVYTRRRRNATSTYHTKKNCGYLNYEPRPAELDELPAHFTECQFCSGAFEGSENPDTKLSAKLENMDPSEVGT